MAGNLEFINETSFTDVASVNIDNVFSADYDVYKMTFDVEKYSGGAVSVEHRLIDSSGSVITASEYDVALLKLGSAFGFTEEKYTSGDDMRGLGVIGASSTNNTQGVAYIFNPYNSSSYTFLLTQSSYYYDASPTSHFSYKGIQVHKSAETIRGLNIYSVSGNYQGIVRTYGLASN
jgi:hypothetical protein